ncbi:LysR family transcriptional regulator [Acidocella sp.]|uniref:LysR family transcriptional regulator n=1 Tax=Acidocella sp. TaxID=50710 RepID=UPI003D057E04
MTLEQLRIFVAVAERQHITRAASVLHLTQAAVSASIATLETQHGVRLFDRVGRNIALTETGRLFLEEARAVLARATAAATVLRDYAGLKHGRLAVHASQTIASYYLPRAIAQFHRLHPGFTIDLAIGNTGQVVSAIKAGDAELGFIEGPLTAPELHVAPVAVDHMAVIVPPNHPWATGRKLTNADLRKAEWVFREEGSGTRDAFLSALAERGISPDSLTIALCLPSNEAVREAVAAGAGTACLSPLVCARPLAAGELKRANILMPPRPFQAVQHKDRYIPKASATFLDLVRALSPLNA